MPIGGEDPRVGTRTEKVRGGERRSLRLPPRRRVRDFVRDAIVPRLKEQAGAGQTAFRVSMALTIDPARGHYSSGS